MTTSTSISPTMTAMAPKTNCILDPLPATETSNGAEHLAQTSTRRRCRLDICPRLFPARSEQCAVGLLHVGREVLTGQLADQRQDVVTGRVARSERLRQHGQDLCDRRWLPREPLSQLAEQPLEHQVVVGLFDELDDELRRVRTRHRNGDVRGPRRVNVRLDDISEVLAGRSTDDT